MAQLYINDLTFAKVYPMKLKSQTADTLSTFIHMSVSQPPSTLLMPTNGYTASSANYAKIMALYLPSLNHIVRGKTARRVVFAN
jgi:hypothetical protein